MDNETQVRRYQATARFHLRMARAFESVGRLEDAESARDAASGCILRVAEAMGGDPDDDYRGEALASSR